jgi:hypothetical protein
MVLVAGCGAAASGGPTSPTPTSPRAKTTSAPASASTFRPTRARSGYAAWRLPFPVARAALTDVGGDPRHSLLAGGMLRDDTSTDRVTELDPTTGSSTPGPSLAVPVHDAAAGPFDGRPAVFGGGNSTEQSVVQELRGGSWHRVTRLPTTRSDLSVASAGGTTLVLGGYDGAQVPRTILRPHAGGLTPHGALRQGVRYAATAVVGAEVFVFGGEVANAELSTVQRVDARTGRTTVVGNLPRPLGHAMAVPVGNRILVLGGRVDPGTQTDAIWWFDPASGRFSLAGRLPVPLSDASVVAVGHRVWLLGGETPDVTDRVIEVSVS